MPAQEQAFLGGQVALVTGASRGIGAATAQALTAAGAKVVLAARDLERCQDVVADIAARGGTAHAFACDVADYRSVEDLVTGTLSVYGGLDILINNAGVIDPIALLADSEPVDWANNVTINLVGAYHVLRAVLPHFIAQERGVVVNVSSGAAHHPLEGWSAYCASKAALAMLTRQCALEAGGHGIRAYGFAPGTVDTRMQEKIRASGLNRVSLMRPEDHAPAHEPARAMAWLCGAEAVDLAGQELSVRDPELRRRAGIET